MATLIVAALPFQSITLAASEPPAKPLKVYILAGQSNMQGHAATKTIPAMELNSEAKNILPEIMSDDGEFLSVPNTWISSIGSSETEKHGQLTVGYGSEARGPKIGPELTFGLYMQKHLNQPILIIKTAWGGKSLHTDFRPPSAGPYQFSQQQLDNFAKQEKDIDQIKADKVAATGHYYKQMLEHVNQVLADIEEVYPEYNATAGYEVAGFVWFQGWNDMVDGGQYPDRYQPGGYDEYSRLMELFIQDIRSDLKTPKLPFVIGVLGVGGPTSEYGPDQKRYQAVHQNFRDAMAAPASSQENVAAVLTENYWDKEVSALRAKERSFKDQRDDIQKQIKSGDLDRSEGNEQIEELYAKNFNQRELRLLRESTSNAEFHYLGSATIMTQIGRAFADAMHQLESGK